MTRLETLKDLERFGIVTKVNESFSIDDAGIKIVDLRKFAIRKIFEYENDLETLGSNIEKLKRKYDRWLFYDMGGKYDKGLSLIDTLCFRIHTLKELVMEIFDITEEDIKHLKKTKWIFEGSPFSPPKRS